MRIYDPGVVVVHDRPSIPLAPWLLAQWRLERWWPDRAGFATDQITVENDKRRADGIPSIFD